MNQIRKFLPFHKQGEQGEQRSYYLHKNGSLLMEDLIATFGPRYNIPIRSFTAEQLTWATNNFSEKLYGHDLGDFYRGTLEGRPVLVKHCWKTRKNVSYFIRDIVITSQMNHHKNVLPLIGCCLELEIPAMVYDDALNHEFVDQLLQPSNSGNKNGNLISWRNRIEIAKDISNILIYLHRAFPSPIIFRDLKVMRVVIDRCGDAKLVGFALSISLPPGELKVEDVIVGTSGYLDPEYLASGFVTEKTDVFNMGVFMLALFSGQPSGIIKCAQEIPNPYGYDDDQNGEILRIHDEDSHDDEDDHSGNDEAPSHGDTNDADKEIRFQQSIPIRRYVKHCIENNQFKQCIDPRIFEEEGQNEHQILQHLLALSSLALKCVKGKGKNRPEMIDVAKQLSQTEKCVRS